ncbi:MAG: hypothetical protein IH827_09795 [Myxococcales bacterium]|nr:hypothetical protein [Myxococcales bacterium]
MKRHAKIRALLGAQRHRALRGRRQRAHEIEPEIHRRAPSREKQCLQCEDPAPNRGRDDLARIDSRNRNPQPAKLDPQRAAIEIEIACHHANPLWLDSGVERIPDAVGNPEHLGLQSRRAEHADLGSRGALSRKIECLDANFGHRFQDHQGLLAEAHVLTGVRLCLAVRHEVHGDATALVRQSVQLEAPEVGALP